MALLDVAIILGVFLFLITAMYAKWSKKPLTKAFEDLVDGSVGFVGKVLKSGGSGRRGKRLSKEELDAYEEEIRLKERRAKLVAREKKVNEKLDNLEGGGEQ